MFSTNFLMFPLRNSPKYFSLAFRSLFLYLVFFFSVSITDALFLCHVYHVRLPTFSLFSIQYHFSVPLFLYPFTYKHKCLPNYQALSPFLSPISLFLSLKLQTPTFKCAHDKKIRRKLNFEKYFSLSKLIYTYILMYLLTAIGLSPGGSSTVHTYTQKVHRTIQNRKIHRTTQQFWKRAGRVPSWLVIPWHLPYN
jgi:hypothetical protein